MAQKSTKACARNAHARTVLGDGGGRGRTSRSTRCTRVKHLPQTCPFIEKQNIRSPLTNTKQDRHYFSHVNSLPQHHPTWQPSTLNSVYTRLSPKKNTYTHIPHTRTYSSRREPSTKHLPYRVQQNARHYSITTQYY